MHKAEAFLRIYPPLHVLMRDGFYIWELVWNEAGRIQARGDKPRPTRADIIREAAAAGVDTTKLEIDADYLTLRGWKRYVLSKCGDFARALKDPQIIAIGSPFHDDLAQGYAALKAARRDLDIVECEELLDSGLEELYAFYNESVKCSLGEWGAWFFERYLEETSPGLGFPNTKFQRELGLNDYRGVRPESIPQFTADDLFNTVTVDEATFSIRWGERTPCRLRNGKQFRLFKVLIDSRGEFVPFLEIAERMGGDEHDADALPVAKRRLVQSLQHAKYDIIAESLRSEPGHYGLFI